MDLTPWCPEHGIRDSCRGPVVADDSLDDVDAVIFTHVGSRLGVTWGQANGTGLMDYPDIRRNFDTATTPGPTFARCRRQRYGTPTRNSTIPSEPGGKGFSSEIRIRVTQAV